MASELLKYSKKIKSRPVSPVGIQLSKNFNKIMSELAEISNRKNQMALEFLKNTYIWFR